MNTNEKYLEFLQSLHKKTAKPKQTSLAKLCGKAHISKLLPTVLIKNNIVKRTKSGKRNKNIVQWVGSEPDMNMVNEILTRQNEILNPRYNKNKTTQGIGAAKKVTVKRQRVSQPITNLIHPVKQQQPIKLQIAMSLYNLKQFDKAAQILKELENE